MAKDLHPQHDRISGNGIFCTVPELLHEGKKSRGKTLHLKRCQSPRTGVRRSAIRGRGMEFFESRVYVPQDEIRNIDWKVSARLNGLYTKTFIEERSRPVFLAIDQRASMYFGSVCCFKSVMAAKIAARLAVAALDGGDYFGGMVFDDYEERECAISGNKINLARFFGLLAKAAQTRSQTKSENKISWHLVLNRIINRVQAGSVVFLVSDFFGFEEHQRNLLYKLRRKADIFAFFVMDPLDAYIPDLGRVGMSFGGKEIIFDSGNRVLARKYETWFKEKNQRLSQMFLSLNIPFISFSTAESLDVSINRIFLGRW
jgi:uncharacterized protein (DUF58 family)